MYGRDYGDKVLNFEPSGGLIHGSLIMQDRETDTYWSIMRGEAIGGALKGAKMQELPYGEKMRWRDWVKKHPDTLVLSVGGREDLERNPYDRYFASDEGYRGIAVRDKRLKTKEPVFTLQFQNRKIAVPHRRIEGGRVFDLGKAKLFLYRPKGEEIFFSSAAFLLKSGELEKKDGRWTVRGTNCVFDPEKLRFTGDSTACPEAITGFDTFWYTWSLLNPDTEVLTK